MRPTQNSAKARYPSTDVGAAAASLNGLAARDDCEGSAHGPTSGGGSPTSSLWTVDVDGWAPSLAEHTVPHNAQSVAAAPGKPLIVGTSSLEIEAFQNNAWQPVFTGPGFTGSSPRYPG